ncbi:MAG: alkaline phosphatase [Planctomycetota bacterium]|jgi:alkaline phosphatase
MRKRRGEIKSFKRIILVLILLAGMGCRPSVQTFYYRMAAPKAGDEGIAFYSPPASDAALVNPPDGEVRNVILCIGDGMGPNHVALARHDAVGGDKKLHMERLPIRGEVTTHSANKAATDSAAAATALACGIKTNNRLVGVAPDKTPYSSILELLQKKGWRTGLTATSAISHATPAGFAAHVGSRNKQNEIAAQLLANRVDVMLGGGQKFWSDDLRAQAKAAGYQIVESRDSMKTLRPAPVIGLFADDGLTTFAPEPSLAEMSAAAMTLLSTPGKEWFAPQPKFFLMIEGSQIDWASHANDTERVVRQTLLFDMAVREAIEFAQRDRHTLVIVTADHETGGLQLKRDEETGEIKAKWTTGGHTGTTVPIYAFGPGSERFSGTLDNTDIPKRIAELTGIKEFPVIKKTLRSIQKTSN